MSELEVTPLNADTVRLQGIKQRNDETSYLVYLPREMVRTLAWQKGERVVVEQHVNHLVLRKEPSA